VDKLEKKAFKSWNNDQNGKLHEIVKIPQAVKIKS
jgi:hypothetical protein